MEEPLRSVNLWECLTSCEYHTRKNDRSPRVTSDFLSALGQKTRFHWQEVSVEPSEEGWIIRVFGCGEDCMGSEVQILISKDYKEAVKILKDQVGDRVYLHDNPR